MPKHRAGGLLLFLALIAVTLWITWPPVSVPRPIHYTCAQGDTLTVTALDTGRVRVAAPGGRSHTLRRVDVEKGTTYRDSSLLFWTNGPSATLHRGSEPWKTGCSATSPPSDTVTYGSPILPGGWRFTLRHRRDVEVSRPNARTTRFLYTGPANDPPALTDGFTVTVRIENQSSLPSAGTQTMKSTTGAGGTILTSPVDTPHRDRPARRWRQQSAMGGSVTHWAVALTPSTVARVSIHTTGADSVAYDAQGRFMRHSLHFWRSRGEAAPRRSVPVALLRDPGGAPERGCDDVVFVEVPVAPSDSRLSQALTALFALEPDSLGGARHFIARTRKTLRYDRAEVRDDTAYVYLRGTVSGLRGVCDHPRARIQIEETARRVADVDGVALFRNGHRTDLQPDGRGDR